MLVLHNLEEKSSFSKFVQHKPGNIKKISGNTRILVESENKARALKKKNPSTENRLLRLAKLDLTCAGARESWRLGRMSFF